MTNTQFRRLAEAAGMGGRSLEAVRLVLVDGLSQHEAARRAGVDVSIVNRRVHAFPTGFCKCCGALLYG